LDVIGIQHGRCSLRLHRLLKPEKVEIFNYVIEEWIQNFVYESSCGCLEAVSSYLPVETAKNWDKGGAFRLWGRIWTLDLLKKEHGCRLLYRDIRSRIYTKYFSLKLRSWSTVFVVMLNSCFPGRIHRVCKLCNSSRASPHNYRHFSFRLFASNIKQFFNSQCRVIFENLAVVHLVNKLSLLPFRNTIIVITNSLNDNNDFKSPV